MSETSLQFGPYRLSGPHGPFFREDRQLKLKPKTLGVLWLLARQAGEVVTKTALLDALWPDTAVGEDALAFQIQELRRVLEDDAKQPRYIATLHRVGYSFIAPVTTAARSGARDQTPLVGADLLESEARHAATFVGRDAQLARLSEHYAKALRGERQVVFVTGEAGVGKTTLVEAFLAGVKESPRIGLGQCVEQHGAGEGYLPVLEALGRICRQPRGGQAIDVLLQIAPTWLMQLPALLSPDDDAALQRRTAGATRERMLREIADALETLSAESPLILVLEDLHWSDPSTIEMLSLLARRSERARLLVLGTYRPADLIVSDHPLKPAKQELVARGQVLEIALGNLHPADVHAYLTRRFPDTGDDGGLSAFVYRRTEGHPLFMAQMADYFAEQDAQGAIAASVEGALEAVVPHGLQELIEVQLGRLSEAQRQALEVASVAGAEFAAASVAAGAGVAIEDVEAHCESLVRHGQFIEDRGLTTWPDGTVSGRYGFRHALYRDILYRRQGTGQRARLHLAIGTREEAGYGGRSAEIAAELALHFERGRDHPRAIRHREQAGEKALQLSANTEAAAHFTRGLELLETLPDTPERAGHELRLHVGASLAFTMTKGYSAPEVERTSGRARELCQQMEESPEVCAAVFRLYQFYHSRAELQTARELAEQLLRIAKRAGDPALLSRAHTAMAHELGSRGEFAAAQKQAERSLATYDPRQHRARGAASGDDPAAVALVVRSWALQVRGYPDQAEAEMRKYTSAAEALSLPYALSAILTSAADLHLLRRSSRAVRESAEAAIALSSRQGFPYFLARATMLHGWALAEEGQAEAGIAETRQGLDAFRAMGATLWMPRYLGVLAEVCGKAEHVDDGLGAVAEALEVARRGEGEYEAELHRLEGELTLAKSSVGGRRSPVGSRKSSAIAEECFQRATAVARRQEAKLFELRATVSLARLWRRQGKKKEAHKALAAIYGWFTEGFETADLEDAKALLRELAS